MNIVPSWKNKMVLYFDNTYCLCIQRLNNKAGNIVKDKILKEYNAVKYSSPNKLK